MFLEQTIHLSEFSLTPLHPPLSMALFKLCPNHLERCRDGKWLVNIRSLFAPTNSTLTSTRVSATHLSQFRYQRYFKSGNVRKWTWNLSCLIEFIQGFRAFKCFTCMIFVIIFYNNSVKYVLWSLYWNGGWSGCWNSKSLPREHANQGLPSHLIHTLHY